MLSKQHLFLGFALIASTHSLSWGKTEENTKLDAIPASGTGTLSPCPYSLTLFRNGAASNGVSAVLPKNASAMSARDLASWAAALVGGFEEDQEGRECLDCLLYDASARQITHCSQMVGTTAPPPYSAAATTTAAGDASPGTSTGASTGKQTVVSSESELWVAAPGRWFVFPPGELGRAVKVPRVKSPRGDDHTITVETISASPRVFHVHNFLSEDEADALVAYSVGNKDPVYGLHRSTTGVEHQVSFNDKRTSENAFDTSSPAAMALKRRAMDLLGMLGKHAYDERLTDGLQVLRYNQSTTYNTHMDYLDDNGAGHDFDSSSQGANRFATMLFYLSDVEEGGETVFVKGAAVDDGEVDVVDGVRLRSPSLTAADQGSVMAALRGELKQLQRAAIAARAERTRFERTQAASSLKPKGGADGDQGTAGGFGGGGGVDGGGGDGEDSGELALKKKLEAEADAAVAKGLAAVKAAEASEEDITKGLFPKQSWQYRFVSECRSKLAVRPKKAHAILFYSQDERGHVDPNSLHGGCPVIEGTKWAANLWIWNKVRLGYADAPRKQGAAKWDSTQKTGRDRLVNGDSATDQQAAASSSRPDARAVVFRNQNVAGAKLFWGDSFFADFPPTGGSSSGLQEMSVNSFVGHEWVVRVKNEEVLRWAVGEEPGKQEFHLTEDMMAGRPVT